MSDKREKLIELLEMYLLILKSPNIDADTIKVTNESLRYILNQLVNPTIAYINE